MNGTFLRQFALACLVTSMLSLASIGEAAADSWTRIFGPPGSGGGDSITDISGNLYYIGLQDPMACCGFNGGTVYNMVVRKVSPTGIELWSDVVAPAERITGRYGVGATSIGKDANGYIYVLGNTNAPITSSIYAFVPSHILIKYDPSTGARIWLQQFTLSAGVLNGDAINDMAVDSFGNTTLVGYTTVGTTSWGAPRYNMVLVRYDSSGTKVFEKVISSIYSEQAASVTVDPSGNTYVALTTSNTTGAWYDPFDVQVIKTDINGAVFWSKKFDIPDMEWVSDITYNPLANTVIVVFRSILSAYYQTPILASLDAGTGAQNWFMFGETYTDAKRVAVSQTGDIFLTGVRMPSIGTGAGVFVSQFSSAGVLAQTRLPSMAASTDTESQGSGIAFDINNNYFIVGSVSCTLSPCTFNGVPVDGNTFILKNLP